MFRLLFESEENESRIIADIAVRTVLWEFLIDKREKDSDKFQKGEQTADYKSSPNVKSNSVKTGRSECIQGDV